jgi:LysM repeat protein
MPGVETSQSGEPTFTPLPATPAAGQAVTHTVQPGENLFRIAQKYNVTVEALMGANGLSDPDTLSAGQVLVIPAGATTGAVTYVVQRGDTLFSIATRHETTVDALVALNGLSSADAIYVGQSLIIHP